MLDNYDIYVYITSKKSACLFYRHAGERRIRSLEEDSDAKESLENLSINEEELILDDKDEEQENIIKEEDEEKDEEFKGK